MTDTIKNRGGFTLIESMLALLVLTFGILTTLQLLTYSTAGARRGKDLTVANHLAVQVFEEFKNSAYTTAVNNLSSGSIVDSAVGSGRVYPAASFFTSAAAADVARRKSAECIYYPATMPDAAKTSFVTGNEVYLRQVVRTSNKDYLMYIDIKEDTPSAGLASVAIEVQWDWEPGKTLHKTSYTSYFIMKQ